MNPNKELLQAIIDGKTVQYQYANPDLEHFALVGAWLNLEPDLTGTVDPGPLHLIFTGNQFDSREFIFRVVD